MSPTDALTTPRSVDGAPLAPSGVLLRDDGRRAALAAFIATKGSLRTSEALLCALYWLDAGQREHTGRRDETSVGPHTGLPDVSARTPEPGAVRASEICALYPKHAGRRIRSAALLLRHDVGRGLVASLGDGWYRITPLGRLVAEALPDRGEVARLRGMRSRPPAARQRG